MRLILAFLAAAGLGLALDNSVTIHEASGSSQTARPTTVFRSFAQGEFAAGTYPKPRIDGSVPSAWQVDVYSTWPDGSVMMAHVSFRLDLTANGSAVVDFIADSNPCSSGNLATCQTAALTQQQMLDYDTGGGSGSWSASWYGSVNSIQYSAVARTMLAAAAWRWMLRGPVVSAVVVEDRSASLAYDFGWQYTGGAWAAPASNIYKSLHPAFEIRFYPDPDGAGSRTAWGGVEVDGILTNGSTTRLQMFNPIALELKTGASENTSAYSISGQYFHARSRRHHRAWSGTAPGPVVIDFNFQYLIHTKLLGPYDYTLAVTDTQAEYWVSEYGANLAGDEPQWCSSHSKCANWTKVVRTTGGRGDIALVASWYLEYMLHMGNPGTTTAKRLEYWTKLVLGNADAGGHLPMHFLETATGKTFFAPYDASDAFGKFGSINARPGWTAGGPGELSDGLSSERTIPVCQSSPCDGRGYISGGGDGQINTGRWTAYGAAEYTSHAPMIYSIPALLTGYHYYLQGAQFEGAYALATTHACAIGSDCRQYAHGIGYFNNPLRSAPWIYRNVLWAYLLTADADGIERAYFADKLRKNARYIEGVMFLTDGAHPPADSTCTGFTISDGASRGSSFDLWCAGKYYWSSGQGGPGVPAANPLFLPDYGSTQSSSTDGWQAGTRRTTRFWTFYLGTSLGWIVSTGAILDDGGKPVLTYARDAVAAHLAGRVLYSPTSMYLLRDIEGPVGHNGALAQNWADHIGAYVTQYTLGADMDASQSTMVINSTDIRNTGYYWLDRSWWKVGNEYIYSSGLFTANSPSAGKSTITLMRRGVWGSAGANHTSSGAVTWLPGPWMAYSANSDGYPIAARSALAAMFRANKRGQYSPREAYYVFAGAMPYTAPPNRFWHLVPREMIEETVVSGGTGTVAMSWLAPGGGACKVHLATAAPASSSDAADADANATYGRRQTYTASGLSSGTYRYRIGCGTARASGEVAVQ